MHTLWVGVTIVPGSTTTVFWKAHTLVLEVQPTYSSRMTAGYFAAGKAAREIKLATHFKLGPKFRMCGVIPHSPICLHHMVFNKHKDLITNADY